LNILFTLGGLHKTVDLYLKKESLVSYQNIWDSSFIEKSSFTYQGDIENEAILPMGDDEGVQVYFRKSGVENSYDRRY